MKANEFKRGGVIVHEGKTWVIRDIDKSAPTSRSAVWTFRFKLDSVPPGTRYEMTVKGEDELDTAELLRRPASYSYMDGDNYVFMDSEDYTQYTLGPDQVADLPLFLTEDGIEGLYVLVIDEQPVGIQLPQSVELEVVETAPFMKGASATGRTKPARFATGLEVQVPEFIASGERLRVNTDSREYMGRA
jgi:elongation factor P